ncbi:hypothetical protein F2Q69_00040024 [Brassica cretica]|uniref:RNase H type-1 domain-containing protein n=1 Tax=Brassica cretica TaxID=69181 RepID=A0A8S9NPS7_BRACR|nr:hypothetical protein F2Q69_00040024 [Brassica cretica]
MWGCDHKITVAKTSGLAWTSAGSSPPINENGTLVQDFVSSPLMAEPLVVRSALSRAVELEIPDLRVFTDCTTLRGEITCKSQRKEILGVLTEYPINLYFFRLYLLLSCFEIGKQRCLFASLH